jgi:hypothetical protein
MKGYLLAALIVMTISSCKKEETFTKQDTYKEIVYRIESKDSNLTIAFMRAVYTETIKGNIQTDSVLVAPNLYNIPATVLTGVPVVLFAESLTGPDFHLQIVDDNGTVLAETDKITFYPANTFHPNQWISKLTVILEG